MKITKKIPITIVADWSNTDYCNSTCRFLLELDMKDEGTIFDCMLYDLRLQKEVGTKARRCEYCINDFGEGDPE